MDEMLFDMSVMLCQKFPALTPMQLRRERAVEVFDTVRKLIRHIRRENAQYITIRGKRMKKRKVRNDSWF